MKGKLEENLYVKFKFGLDNFSPGDNDTKVTDYGCLTEDWDRENDCDFVKFEGQVVEGCLCDESLCNGAGTVEHVIMLTIIAVTFTIFHFLSFKN